MSDTATDRLYDLLPAIYRTKDAEQQQTLQALFAVLENDFSAMENDIAALYDNWFIETCDEWVVPYISDLLKVKSLHSGGIAGFTLRSYVANVLAYRRRKGTASVLEQMAHDVSGWPTRAVEFYKSLATNQHMNNIRATIPAFIDIRDSNNLELLSGPFEQAAYRIDVRSVEAGVGKYNIPNIGLYLWRLQSYSMVRVRAAAQASGPEPQNRFCFNPLGVDLELFNPPQTELDISHLAEQHNVPGVLRRRPLFHELQARRQAISESRVIVEKYFRQQQAVFKIYTDGASEALLPEEIMVCDLSDWQTEISVVSEAVKVQVDPELGRLVFHSSLSPSSVDVDYSYGFSADLGGGPYNRSESLDGLFDDQDSIWWAAVSQHAADNADVFTTLGAAIQAWNALDPADSASAGVIAIQDNASYTETLSGDSGKIHIPDGKKLLIVAAQWLRGSKPTINEWSPQLGLNHFLSATQLRPHIQADISVSGAVSADSDDTTSSNELWLNGLLVQGKLSVLVGELGQLTLSHCSLVPNAGGLQVNSSNSVSGGHNAQLAVVIDHSICGAILLADTVRSLSISDSIIDALAAAAVDEAAFAITGFRDTESRFAPPTTIQRSTLFGLTNLKELSLATEVIFTQTITVERMQVGCVRFSYVPPDSLVPRRFRCQPDLAISEKAKQLNHTLNDSERRRQSLLMRPVFSSEQYGDPGYAQLNITCPICPHGIRIGAEDGSEMGVFSHLKQPQREANILSNLKEYLRFGMAAGLFYVN